MKTLVLGLGNPILTDDAVGLRVAQDLRGKVNQPEVTIGEANLGGINLMELLRGYDRAILIDAIQTENGRVGQVYRFESDALDSTRHTATLHDVNLATALALGRQIGVALPEKISIYAVEVEDVTTFSEKCTATIEDVVPSVANMVFKELEGDRDA